MSRRPFVLIMLGPMDSKALTPFVDNLSSRFFGGKKPDEFAAKKAADAAKREARERDKKLDQVLCAACTLHS